jgi:signal transduction histidine kinase
MKGDEHSNGWIRPSREQDRAHDLDGTCALADPASMRLMRPQLLLILGVTTFLTLISSALSYSFALTSAKPDLARAVYLNGTYWFAWALLTPPILGVARRFRFERQTWRAALAVHLPVMLAACFAHVALTVGARLWAGYAREGWTFWMTVRDSYLTQVDWELMTYCAIVGASHAVYYHRAAVERQVQAVRLESSLVEARLLALQRQLHPHFLFNTLHGISALMHRDLDAADRMIALLADLLRASLKINTQEIPLKDELDLLQRYLDIERIRFGDRLTVTYDIEPETLDARVPSLVLQPLVENAIEHGIAPTSRPGGITIHARRQGHMLWMEVRDDGAGLSEDALEALQKGIGVSNTRSRLRHLYGSAHRFEFVRPGSRGLSVRVVLPWHAEASTPAHPEALETAL